MQHPLKMIYRRNYCDKLLKSMCSEIFNQMMTRIKVCLVNERTISCEDHEVNVTFWGKAMNNKGLLRNVTINTLRDQ